MSSHNKPTGPRAPKRVAFPRLKALRTGINPAQMVIPGEQAVDLEKIDTDYYERWAPVAPDERFWVDVLIHDEWRRLRRVEASLLASRMQSPDPQLSVYRAEDKALDRFGRIMGDIGRSAEHAVKELKRAKAHPIRRPAPPQPSSGRSPGSRQFVEMPGLTYKIGSFCQDFSVN